MKTLFVHSDFIEFYPKQKAVKAAEEWKQERQRIEECLVVFTAVEKNDEKNIKGVIERYIHEIKKVAGELKADKIVLYPYAHLSKDLSSADAALAVFKQTAELLSKEFVVARAPFGWYKEFNIKCKGHPLSELSREINMTEESAALQKEKEELKSEWFVLDIDGKKHPIEIKDGNVNSCSSGKINKNSHDINSCFLSENNQSKIGFDFSKHPKLAKLCRYEMAKSRIVDVEPPHIRLMRKLELVDYEPGSDPGNLRFYPKGRLVKGLLEDFVTRETVKYGAMEVETPLMYDYEHPALKNYLNRFPARQYSIQTPNKKTFLRFSACFGQFLMKKDTMISYRNLPLRMYELTRYSFRVEQRGELAGLRRLRAFTMPDCHALVKDFEQAKQEVGKRFDLSVKVIEGTGLSINNDMELAIRVVKDFYEEHKEFVHNMVRKWGRPALLEIWDKQFFYFVYKHEFNFIDALDKAATLTTDQIDIENAERYGIQYTDADNQKKYPLILHLSPSGAIERVMYALLEKFHMQQKAGINSMFPLWLAPIQVRLCPVNDTYVDYANEILKKLEKNNIRADIDDRTESIGKKVRDAEIEWVNMSIVLGEKEKESSELPVRMRETGKVEKMTLDDLIVYINFRTKGFPFRELSLPKLLTRRPVFYG
ncbi:MAG: threonine--tRNA ligase [Candidatus Aenigmarchaeota archaeon]|nr:threonine--tRNA ligase [Candidatus Aenigmarchaeota archaeon]